MKKLLLGLALVLGLATLAMKIHASDINIGGISNAPGTTILQTSVPSNGRLVDAVVIDSVIGASTSTAYRLVFFDGTAVGDASVNTSVFHSETLLAVTPSGGSLTSMPTWLPHRVSFVPPFRVKKGVGVQIANGASATASVLEDDRKVIPPLQ